LVSNFRFCLDIDSATRASTTSTIKRECTIVPAAMLRCTHQTQSSRPAAAGLPSSPQSQVRRAPLRIPQPLPANSTASHIGVSLHDLLPLLNSRSCSKLLLLPLTGALTIEEDRSHGMVRTEIMCANCGGHLGHVFKGEGYDTPTDERFASLARLKRRWVLFDLEMLYLRYRHCVNSISLRFKGN
jgi:hypothetical protein